MTRILRWWTALLLCLILPAGLAHAAPTTAVERFKVEPAPSGWSGAVAVLDWQTGELLYGRNAHSRRDPASTTKVLTALLALERGRLDDLVKVSRRAGRTPGSSMYIKEGDVYSLHDLLYGLLLRSGNDAAAAIAEHLSGSVEEFAKLMTRRAKELGAKNSHFANPHGLTHPQHFSTAYDLAIITRAALTHPTFREIVAKTSSPITYEQLGREATLYNTNKLLGLLEGADGVKTGTTAAAGPCLIASATRGEQKLIAVVLHAGNRWREAADLLEWGFRNFQVARLGQEGEVLRTLPVQNGKWEHVGVALQEDLSLVLPRTGGQVPEIQVDLQTQVVAPVRKGQPLGKAIIALADGRDLQVPLVAAEAIPEATWVDRIYRLLVSLLQATDSIGINLLLP